MVRPPFLARIISLFIMLSSLPFFAAALFIFLSSGVVRQGIENMLGGVFAGMLFFVGMFFLALAIVYFVVGLGLWRGRGWAHIIIVFLSGFWLVISLLMLFSGVWPSIGSLIIHMFLTWYFMRKRVRAAYR